MIEVLGVYRPKKFQTRLLRKTSYLNLIIASYNYFMMSHDMDDPKKSNPNVDPTTGVAEDPGETPNIEGSESLPTDSPVH